MRKYVAQNDKAYLEARSLKGLARKIEKHLFKVMTKELSYTYDHPLFDIRVEVYALDRQVHIYSLGKQYCSIKGIYRVKSKIDTCEIKREFTIYEKI